METNYSIFSTTSTNSPSSSSNNNNFPFSLNHNEFNIDYDYHGRNNDNSETLFSTMMMMGADDKEDHYYNEPSIEVPRVQSQPPLMDNNSEINTNDIKDDKSKNSKKKGLSLEKKIKKHRYAFQTRSQVDILDDGYRWRKYGQKAVKNNKFPRSYYRCTNQGCNVKKQVQRLSKDDGVVVTTYEGFHSHSIDTPTDNFEHILSQMQIYTSLSDKLN